MSNKKKIAVVGLGNYSSNYHIPHLMANENVEIVGICDISSERLSEIGAQTGAQTFTDIGDMLNSLDVDGVIVSTPHTLHYQHIRTALESGANVLTDKPFTLDVAEAQELIALADSKRVRLMVALNRHLDSANLAAQKAINRGELGDLVFVRTLQAGLAYGYGQYDTPELVGGGPLVSRGTHMASLIPWMTGLRPVRVNANVLGGDKPIDIGGLVNIELENGVLWQMACVPDVYKNIDEAQVIGTKGSATVWRPTETYGPFAVGLVDENRQETILDVAELPESTTTTDHFIEVLSGKESRIPVIHAVYSVAIIHGAYESVRQGRPIEIAEDGSLS